NPAFFWTGNGQHERGGITEVAVELDRSCPLRKIGDFFQLEIDVVEFGLAQFYSRVQLHKHYREAVEADRFDTIVIRTWLAHPQVFRYFLFHPAGHQLFDFFRLYARPGSNSRCDSHWDVWIFTLGHFE